MPSLLKNKKETPGSLIVVKGTEGRKKMVCTLLIQSQESPSHNRESINRDGRVC
jgi:hypothetical protein